MTAIDSHSVVDGFLEAFASDDFDGMLAHCSPEMRSVDYSAVASGIRGEYVGPSGLADQMEAYDAVLDTTSFEVAEIVGGGDTFAVRTRLGLRSKRTGETWDGPLVLVLEVTDGKISLMETYPTEPETFYTG